MSLELGNGRVETKTTNTKPLGGSLTLPWSEVLRVSVTPRAMPAGASSPGTVDKPITKISPFVIQKSIQSIAGTVKNVSKMRSGNLLVECNNKSPSANLLKMKTINGFAVSASAHASLNSSKGIIRDRSQYLSDLTPEEICEEFSNQGVTDVVRFQIKKDDQVIKINTYLLTFKTPTPPSSLKLGCFGIKVDIYIPNPIRCFKCQKFGHGTKQCHERNISYTEAKQIASVSSDFKPTTSKKPSYGIKGSCSFSHESTQTRMNWSINDEMFTMLPVETTI
ncbi:Hypothetical predicted protein [Mytilus galloprovincialis]|uniref:CCHC-type domain-containing protein n=1 Tax=Mytilus galloprovincialis TaxID=29158 RepID=A0A8B6DVH2_MYTGA|nr:Hypothetical predicted protein [Mytilus galloprovincialis]